MAASDAGSVADRETVAASGARLKLRIWLRLLTCTQTIESTIRARLRAEFDTTLARFDVLAALDSAGTDLTMGALSARLMVTSGNVTALIDTMEQDRLVARRPHPGDRRSTLIAPTKQGRALFARMAPAHAHWIEEAMASLDRREALQLWEALGHLKASMRGRASVEADNAAGRTPDRPNAPSPPSPRSGPRRNRVRGRAG